MGSQLWGPAFAWHENPPGYPTSLAPAPSSIKEVSAWCAYQMPPCKLLVPAQALPQATTCSMALPPRTIDRGFRTTVPRGVSGSHR
eukprot:363670-Chlamydomonas_euryale.AAC.24